MRSFLLLLLGAGIGLVGTLMFITVDPVFQTDERDGAGGGNARLSFDEDALAALVYGELRGAIGYEDVTRLDVRIMGEGSIELAATVAADRIMAQRWRIVLNPDIHEGRLTMRVVEAEQIEYPEEVARMIEEPLQVRLDSLAEGLEYRLASITTTERRLTLEISVKT